MLKKFVVFLVAAVLCMTVFCGCEITLTDATQSQSSNDGSVQSVTDDSSGSLTSSDISGQSENDSSAQSIADDSSSAEDPADDETEKSIDAFFEKITDSVEEIKYSYAGDFYQKELKTEFAEVEQTEEKGVFDLKIFNDYKDCSPFVFTLKSDAGTFITEEGETHTITVSAGEEFTWKAAEIGKLILENSDKSYNYYYNYYYKDGSFRAGYIEYQFIDIELDCDDKKMGYGSINFFLAVSDDVIRYDFSRFFFIPEIIGGYQNVSAEKLFRAQTVSKTIYDEEQNADLVMYGPGVYFPRSKPSVCEAVKVVITAEARDEFFGTDITPEMLGLDSEKCSVPQKAFQSYVGWEGFDCGVIQVSIKNSSPEAAAEVVKKLWRVDFVVSVGYFHGFSLDGSSPSQTEESVWAEHFDLTDEKIISYTEVDHTTLRSYLRIFLKKAKDDYRVTVEDFENENVEAVLYGFFEPDERRLNEEGYLENFRQDIYLYLKYTPDYKMSDEELLNVIHDIEELDFVKAVYTIRAVNG